MRNTGGHFDCLCVFLQGNEHSGDLLIKNIQVRHAGHYICTAQTIVDNATAEADVFVKGWCFKCVS